MVSLATSIRVAHDFLSHQRESEGLDQSTRYYHEPRQGLDDLRVTIEQGLQDLRATMEQGLQGLQTDVQGLKADVQGLQTNAQDLRGSVQSIQNVLGVHSRRLNFTFTDGMVHPYIVIPFVDGSHPVDDHHLLTIHTIFDLQQLPDEMLEPYLVGYGFTLPSQSPRRDLARLLGINGHYYVQL